MSEEGQFDMTDDDTLSADENTEEVRISVDKDDAVDNVKESNSDNPTNEKVKRKRVYYRAPLIVAACIFLATLVAFGVWKCFFDTSIEGTWGIKIDSGDNSETVSFNLTFDDNKTARFQSGGIVYIGRYEFADDEEYGNVLNLYIPVYGQIQLYQFGYDFDGNIFTGRSIILTDLTGMFLSPDDNSTSEEEIERKKKATDSVDINGITYYKWNFTPSVEDYKISKSDDFKKDDKIIGSWLYKNDDIDYTYTMTFTEDGAFEQLAPDLEIHGTYTVKDGVCVTSFCPMGGITLSEQSLGCTVDGDKLTLESNEFVKTDDKYAYQSENN